MSSTLNASVIWLTGASSGIGKAYAERLSRENCKLAITARRQETLEKMAQELSSGPAEVRAYAGDVTDLARMKEIATEIERDFGPIGRLVANAGSHYPTDISDFHVEQYRSIMELNYLGVLNCIEAVLPKMIERKSGQIVGVSSVAGYRGLPTAAAYGASKAALTHFLESVRFDLEQFKIDVSVVSPGFVRTPLTDQNEFPMPFLMEPQNAAEAMFLGIERREKEIHFPKRFTFILKFLRVIPLGIYHWFIKTFVLPRGKK